MKPSGSRAALGTLSLVVLLALGGCSADAPEPDPAGDEAARDTAGVDAESPGLVALWEEGRPAFGIFVPDERPRGEGPRGEGPRPPSLYTAEGGRRLAENPLLDFAFLNLEGGYDPQAVSAMVEGMEAEGGGPTLLVRIPTIEDAGVDSTRARVREVLERGADGVVIPHVRSLEEARTAVSFFEDAGADVWSPANPDGRVVAMLMLEDPDAVAQAAEIADLPGYSVLACGIGSLTRAMDGDREGAEAGCLEVMAEGDRAGKANMMTADAESVMSRLAQGYVGILLQGPSADSVIRVGRAAAGRR